MKFDGQKFSQKLGRLLVSPGLEPALQSARIHAIERDIVLPIKTLICLTLTYYFYFARWIEKPKYMREVAFDTIGRWFLVYILVNLIVGVVFIRLKQIPLNLIQWTVYATGFLDGLLFAALTFVTDGFDSIVFWIFPALILRNAISIPHAVPQL